MSVYNRKKAADLVKWLSDLSKKDDKTIEALGLSKEIIQAAIERIAMLQNAGVFTAKDSEFTDDDPNSSRAMKAFDNRLKMNCEDPSVNCTPLRKGGKEDTDPDPNQPKPKGDSDQFNPNRLLNVLGGGLLVKTKTQIEIPTNEKTLQRIEKFEQERDQVTEDVKEILGSKGKKGKKGGLPKVHFSLDNCSPIKLSSDGRGNWTQEVELMNTAVQATGLYAGLRGGYALGALPKTLQNWSSLSRSQKIAKMTPSLRFGGIKGSPVATGVTVAAMVLYYGLVEEIDDPMELAKVALGSTIGSWRWLSLGVISTSGDAVLDLTGWEPGKAIPDAMAGLLSINTDCAFKNMMKSALVGTMIGGATGMGSTISGYSSKIKSLEELAATRQAKQLDDVPVDLRFVDEAQLNTGLEDRVIREMVNILDTKVNNGLLSNMEAKYILELMKRGYFAIAKNDEGIYVYKVNPDLSADKLARAQKEAIEETKDLFPNVEIRHLPGGRSLFEADPSMGVELSYLDSIIKDIDEFTENFETLAKYFEDMAASKSAKAENHTTWFFGAEGPEAFARMSTPEAAASQKNAVDAIRLSSEINYIRATEILDDPLYIRMKQVRATLEKLRSTSGNPRQRLSALAEAEAEVNAIISEIGDMSVPGVFGKKGELGDFAMRAKFYETLTGSGYVRISNQYSKYFEACERTGAQPMSEGEWFRLATTSAFLESSDAARAAYKRWAGDFPESPMGILSNLIQSLRGDNRAALKLADKWKMQWVGRLSKKAGEFGADEPGIFQLFLQKAIEAREREATFRQGIPDTGDYAVPGVRVDTPIIKAEDFNKEPVHKSVLGRFTGKMNQNLSADLARLGRNTDEGFEGTAAAKQQAQELVDFFGMIRRVADSAGEQREYSWWRPLNKIANQGDFPDDAKSLVSRYLEEPLLKIGRKIDDDNGISGDLTKYLQKTEDLIDPDKVGDIAKDPNILFDIMNPPLKGGSADDAYRLKGPGEREDLIRKVLEERGYKLRKPGRRAREAAETEGGKFYTSEQLTAAKDILDELLTYEKDIITKLIQLEQEYVAKIRILDNAQANKLEEIVSGRWDKKSLKTAVGEEAPLDQSILDNRGFVEHAKNEFLEAFKKTAAYRKWTGTDIPSRTGGGLAMRALESLVSFAKNRPQLTSQGLSIAGGVLAAVAAALTPSDVAYDIASGGLKSIFGDPVKENLSNFWINSAAQGGASQEAFLNSHNKAMSDDNRDEEGRVNTGMLNTHSISLLMLQSTIYNILKDFHDSYASKEQERSVFPGDGVIDDSTGNPFADFDDIMDEVANVGTYKTTVKPLFDRYYQRPNDTIDLVKLQSKEIYDRFRKLKNFSNNLEDPASERGQLHNRIIPDGVKTDAALTRIYKIAIIPMALDTIVRIMNSFINDRDMSAPGYRGMRSSRWPEGDSGFGISDQVKDPSSPTGGTFKKTWGAQWDDADDNEDKIKLARRLMGFVRKFWNLPNTQRAFKTVGSGDYKAYVPPEKTRDFNVLPGESEIKDNFVEELQGKFSVKNLDSLVRTAFKISFDKTVNENRTLKEPRIMNKKEIYNLIKEAFGDAPVAHADERGYSKYPYSSSEDEENQEEDDYMETWKSFCLEVIQDQSKNQAIKLAKIFINDLELFEDVLDIAGQNQSLGHEILKKMEKAEEIEEVEV